jgi:Domain of unknown function (DUF6970)
LHLRSGWRRAVPALLLLGGATGCAAGPITGLSPYPDPALPDGILELISRLQAEPVSDPPASLYRFEYYGATVYYLPPACCDLPSQLYDESGKVLCAPSGGITGGGNGRCPDFREIATGGEIVWKDTRLRRR